MACKGRQKNKPNPSKAILQFNELVLIKYKGLLDLDVYFGEVTLQRYEFGLFKNEGYIDSRDVKGFKNIVEDGQYVFEVP